MIAVIYRFRLKPGREEEYKRHWQNVVNYFREHRGAIGSTLHQSNDGLWCVYSLWPSEEIRDQAWPLTSEIREDSKTLAVYIEQELAHMKACVEEKLPDIKLNMVNDLLMTNPVMCEEAV
ncbi:MAG: hypothetical protein A3C55_02495 [Gammaproteobacteria bacterium RIFCSPHIGHO2_02_FULL_42_13]|nr:MAG: hypothetical protein A3C55_02495 [Gammaproteobacteria bacterium RIFCSPHIGHO2_02_FULL_42_13]OGT68826.1 MAG: hypothetical protein A3H43_06075 [Gammaproteobacteria bacterium RIFCSPLOWO2_02_FULL_42_9]